MEDDATEPVTSIGGWTLTLDTGESLSIRPLRHLWRPSCVPDGASTLRWLHAFLLRRYARQAQRWAQRLLSRASVPRATPLPPPLRLPHLPQAPTALMYRWRS